MGVKLGNLDISSFKVGSGDCTIYLGETLLYSGGTPTPPTPTYTWVTIDDNFVTSTPVYEIHVDWLTTDDDNESFGFYDNPSFSTSGNGRYYCNIDYDENSGLYELEILQYPSWTTVYSHSYSSSTDINLDFIAIFGKPMYFYEAPFEDGDCLNEECISEECPPGCEDCAEWDEETGECIETTCNCPPECIEWNCTEYETLYIATAKIIQQN